MESFNLNVKKSLLPSFISNRKLEKMDFSNKNNENSLYSTKFDDFLKANLKDDQVHAQKGRDYDYDHKVKDNNKSSFEKSKKTNPDEIDTKETKISVKDEDNKLESDNKLKDTEKKTDAADKKDETKKTEDEKDPIIEANITKLISDILKLIKNSKNTENNSDQKIAKDISIKSINIDDIKDVMDSQKNTGIDTDKILKLLEEKTDKKFSAELKKEIKVLVDKIIEQLENKKQNKTSIAFHNSRKMKGHESEIRNHVSKNLSDSNSSISSEIKAENENLIKISSSTLENSDNNKSDFSDFSRQDSSLKNISLKGKDSPFLSKKPDGLLYKEQLNEIINKSRLVVKNNGDSRILMKLFPEKLGNMNVNIAMDSGQLNAKFLVESTDAKELLMHDLELLKENLAQQGVEVGSFEVNVRSDQKQMSDFGENEKDNILTNPINDQKNEQINDLVENIETDYRSGHLNLVW